MNRIVLISPLIAGIAWLSLMWIIIVPYTIWYKNETYPWFWFILILGSMVTVTYLTLKLQNMVAQLKLETTNGSE